MTAINKPTHLKVFTGQPDAETVQPAPRAEPVPSPDLNTSVARVVEAYPELRAHYFGEPGPSSQQRRHAQYLLAKAVNGTLGEGEAEGHFYAAGIGKDSPAMEELRAIRFPRSSTKKVA